jgi:hypothetical protein
VARPALKVVRKGQKTSKTTLVFDVFGNNGEVTKKVWREEGAENIKI